MTRRVIFAANWKMNHGPESAGAFARRFLELTAPVEGRELWFFPPIVSLAAVAGVLGERPTSGSAPRTRTGRRRARSPVRYRWA